MSQDKPDGSPDGDGPEPDPFARWIPDRPQEENHDRLVGRMVGGVWIGRCIGQGGMGRVYEGLSRDRGEAVAVKVIQPGLASIEHLEALRREARILGLFDHPGIAPVYAAGTEVIDGREVPFLVMKLIRGARTIIDFAVEEQLSTRQRVKLFRKVCAAVGHGHGRSIIHRDLKPSNILVDTSGNPFIIDFGVARSLNPELTRLAARDRTGEIPGTYMYMSPEQFKGDPDGVDKRTDVYSLGLILYELLTGKLPYDIANKNPAEMSRIVQFEPPVPLESRRPDLKPAAALIVGKCLEKRSAHRYPDATALLAAFIGVRHPAPALSNLRRRFRTLSRNALRYRGLLAGVVLGASLALAGERMITSLSRHPMPLREAKQSEAEPKPHGRGVTPASEITSAEPASPDMAGLDAAVSDANVLGKALMAMDDTENEEYMKLRTRWYQALVRVAEELVAIDNDAAKLGRPLVSIPDSVVTLHDGISRQARLMAALAVIGPDWLACAKRSSDGIILPVTFESARNEDPYWVAQVSLTGTNGKVRDLNVISRREPAATTGDYVVVTGVARDDDVIWAADIRTCTTLTTDDNPTAVDRALKWIVDHQLEDGSWSFKLRDCPACMGKCSHSGTTEDRAGATALALLPFVGHGYTHKKGPYMKQVERGITFLATKAVTNNGKVYDGEGTMYSQGLAGIALSECYRLTLDSRMAQPTQLALNVVMSAQDQRGGGWWHQPGQPGDVVSTGCQIMALKSGNMAYLQVNPLTIKKAVEFFDSVQVKKGYEHRAAVKQESADPRSTAVALLCRMYLGWKKDNPAFEEGARYLAKIGPTEDLTYDLYATEVMHHMEGDVWQAWNVRMKPMLLKTQSTKDHEYGSWYEGFEDSEEAKAGGRLFCTATAALILEVYYHYPRIYRDQTVEDEFKE